MSTEKIREQIARAQEKFREAEGSRLLISEAGPIGFAPVKALCDVVDAQAATIAELEKRLAALELRVGSPIDRQG